MSGWSLHARNAPFLLEWRVRRVVYKCSWESALITLELERLAEIKDEAPLCSCTLCALYLWLCWLVSLWQNSLPQSHQGKKRRVSRLKFVSFFACFKMFFFFCILSVCLKWDKFLFFFFSFFILKWFAKWLFWGFSVEKNPNFPTQFQLQRWSNNYSHLPDAFTVFIWLVMPYLPSFVAFFFFF